MSDKSDSSRTQIIVAIIGVIGAIGVAIVSKIDWNDNNQDPQPTEQEKHTDPLNGFYVRDGLANGPVMKITSIGGSEYKLNVFNHPWPWEAIVRLNGSNLAGFGRFPESKATMDFKGRVSGDGSIHSEYHFITKGDGTSANGRVDEHIWTLRTN